MVRYYPDNHASHPNRLKREYGGDSGNSHPNSNRVWRGTDPYFVPTGDPETVLSASPWQYDDTGALGNAAVNYFYLVDDVLSDGILSTSNRVGEFDYTLMPGSV